MTSNSQNTDITSLDRSVGIANLLVGILVAITIGAYFIWFGIRLSLPLSESPEVWGQFGDFVGGLMNPIVAYAAFFWLTRSIRIQKEELLENRKLLNEAAEYSAEQAEHSRMSAYLSALSCHVASISTEIELKRNELQFIIDQISKNPSGGARCLNAQYLTGEALSSHMNGLNEFIIWRMAERSELEGDIRGIVQAFRQLEGKSLNYKYRRPAPRSAQSAA